MGKEFPCFSVQAMSPDRLAQSGFGVDADHFIDPSRILHPFPLARLLSLVLFKPISSISF
jgi:hypothetical protein